MYKIRCNLLFLFFFLNFLTSYGSQAGYRVVIEPVEANEEETMIHENMKKATQAAHTHWNIGSSNVACAFMKLHWERTMTFKDDFGNVETRKTEEVSSPMGWVPIYPSHPCQCELPGFENFIPCIFTSLGHNSGKEDYITYEYRNPKGVYKGFFSMQQPAVSS